MFLESTPPPGTRLNTGRTFRFRCHKNLACFNTCCRNKHLPLTPYDILRLKKALGLHSDVFLSRYTGYRIDPASGFPIVSLTLSGDDAENCPFVGPGGCSVYQDRPTACRLFPLGRSTTVRAPAEAREEVYGLLEIPGCGGGDSDVEWLVESWVRSQGLTPYLAMNDAMLGLLFHPRRDRGVPLDGRQLQKVMVACYNLDLFREFVFRTNFLERFEVPQRIRAAIQEDERDLLELGIAYLRKVLF